MRLHQALEEPVAKYKYLLTAVQRFPEAEQPDRIAERGNDLVDGGVDGFVRIDGERNRSPPDPVIQCGICS
ncbi:MAG: hypothetical protein P8123_04425 [bacterium]